MKLAWGRKVSAEFASRVCEAAERLWIPDASWLMACMAFETGRTFSASVRNPSSGATGLIQFMPSTARGLGTTTDYLAEMSAEDQLDYVEHYFLPYRGRIASLADCYMAILWPRAVGEPEEYRIFAEGSQAYLLNKGLDLDKDGAVTKGEATAKVARLLAEGLSDENASEVEPQAEDEPAPAPAPEAPTMTPFLLPAINALVQSAPDLIRIVGKGPVSERNAQVAEKIVGVAKAVTSSASGEEAVSKIQADPAMAERFRAEVQARHDEWLGTVTKLNELDEASREKARAFARMGERVEVFGRFSFIEFLSVLFVLIGAAGGGYVIMIDGFSQEMKSAVITLMLIAGYTGVQQFWLGSSLGSMRKDSPAPQRNGT